MMVKRPKIVELERPGLVKELATTFNWMQDEGSSVAKAVSKLRDIYEKAENKDEYFRLVSFMIKLPLTSGSIKERMARRDDKILDAVCQFGVSFLQQQKLEGEKIAEANGEEDGDDDEDSSVDFPPFLRQLFYWLLDHHEAEGSQTRFRICLMVNRLLRLLGEDAEIDGDLYQKIYDNMLDRLKDKFAEIRAQAVTALQRLQNPHDDSCRIVKAFIFHLDCDPSPIVRRIILKCIGVAKATLPHIVRRTLDVDDSVRRTAYNVMADKIHIKSLTISQREEIVRRGLMDRNEGVRSVVAKALVPAWLRLCNDNVADLLYTLDVGNSDGETAKEVLNVIFKEVSGKELIENFGRLLDSVAKLVPVENLSPETAIYWCQLAKFLHAEYEKNGISDAATCLEQFLPELAKFCQYVKSYIFQYGANRKLHSKDSEAVPEEDEEAKEVAWLFVAKRLLGMMSVFDLADETGRQNLLKLCRELLSSRTITNGLTESTMRVFAYVETNVNTRITEVAKIITDLREPPTSTSHCSEEEKDNNEEEIEDGVMVIDVESSCDEKPSTECRNLDSSHKELPKLEDEQSCIVLKCLEMLGVLLESNDIKHLNGTLLSLLEEFIIPSVQNVDCRIRKAAVTAIGSCCIRSLNAAKGQLLLILQMVHLDLVEVRMVALSVVFDWLMWHGPPAFINAETESTTSNPDEGNDDISTIDSVLSGTGGLEWHLTQNQLDSQGGDSVVALLSQLLDDLDIEIRTRVIEGLCKLMMVRWISSSKLFSRLILVWYNPMMEANGKLRHILGTFFPLYASLSRANQDTIEEAFMPTVNTLLDAPATSPLAKVDVENVGAFFVQMTRADLLQHCPEANNKDPDIATDCGASVHDALAFSICDRILANQDSFHLKFFVKLLSSLQITVNNHVKLKELNYLNKQMMDVVKDKLCLKSLEKFGARLEYYLSQNPRNKERVENGDVVEAVSETVDGDILAEVSFSPNSSLKLGRRKLTLLDYQDEEKEEVDNGNLLMGGTGLYPVKRIKLDGTRRSLIPVDVRYHGSKD